MTPAELATDLERRAAQAEAVGATAPLAATYRAIAAELASLNGNGAAPTPHPDRLLTAGEVAPRLGCSRRYIYAHAKDFPFVRKIGNLVRFSEAGLVAWITRGRAA